MNVELARRQMVDQQVRAWDVLDDRVLDALFEVPRERFVPPAYARLAFADTEIPLGYGEVMMTPKVEGRLLQALELEADDDVLEIGTGSGFLAACLARLTASVMSIDIRAVLSERAGESLRGIGIDTIELQTRDAMQLDPQPQFDAVAITASLPVYDDRFERLLRPAGRLFVIVGSIPIMEARRVRRVTEDEWSSESLFETAIPPMINAPQPAKFIF
ncbi:protein-L-isoaspartate O-methyltransferase [soil metagenome]